MILDLVGATQIKKWVCYSGVPALHSAAEVVIKCPAGLLSAYFLALKYLFHHCLSCLEQDLGEEVAS